MKTQDQLKSEAAQQVLDHLLPKLEPDMVLGIGTGSTTNIFIDLLGAHQHLFLGAIASSQVTADRLHQQGVPVYELNTVNQMSYYIDGADEANPNLQLIKGGGGALTREKILAQCADQFYCIVDETKEVPKLGSFPLPIEVIPMARSLVGREVLALGGDPVYRDGFVTDNGNIIIDVYGLDLTDPFTMEQKLNQIVGSVTNGLFAGRPADLLFVADQNGTHIKDKQS